MTTVLRAFLDDSGDHTHPAMSIAGYVGNEKAWQTFEIHWQSALDRHAIPYFHMKEICKPKSPLFCFNGKVNGDRLAVLLNDLALALTKCWAQQFCGIGCVVPKQALNKFNHERGRKIEPVALAIYTCIGLMQNEFPGSTIEASLDRMTKADRSIAIAKEYLASNPRPVNGSKVAITTLKGDLSAKSVRPLQAADFAAWEGRKKFDRLAPFFESVDLSQVTSNKEIWYEYENWLENNNRPSPDERKSMTALSAATDFRYPIWLYEVLCAEDDLRNGIWRC